MIRNVDICVVGAGPAGMAAAEMAARHGLSVALLDERPSAGGQIYRGLEDGPFRSSAALGADYRRGANAISRFRTANVMSFFGVNLWRIDMSETGGVVSFVHDGASSRLAFGDLILATGAMERPVPFEGWSLPGVMGVGAAQLLLKTSAVTPSGRIALAGNGPLLLLFATQLLKRGVEISAILDTAPTAGKRAIALRHARSLVLNAGKVLKGANFIRAIRQAGVSIYHDVSALSASGNERISSITFEAGRDSRTIDVDALLVHEGIIPNTQLSRALGCRQVWDPSQTCLRPETDPFGESSVARVFIVGDGAAITGAVAAPASAQIAVGRILNRLGHGGPELGRSLRRASKTLSRERAFRPFLDALYPPRLSVAAPDEATILCRCEEVTAGMLHAAIKDGAIGPSQAKAFTRCGMGACQGRVCGPIVSQLMSAETGRPIDEVGSYHVRYPLKPVTVLDMALSGSDVQPEGGEHAA